MIPSFKNNDYSTGIINGFYAIINEVYTEYGIEYEASDYIYVGEYSDENEEERSINSIAVIFLLF